MKKILVIILASAMFVSLILTGCGDKTEEAAEKIPKADNLAEETNKAEESKDLDYANMTAEDLIKDIKDVKNITADEYLALIETYKYVKMDDKFVMEENITDGAFKLLKEQEAEYPNTNEFIEKGFQSSEAVVRAEALRNMGSLFGVDEANIKRALEIAEKEEEPYVLYTLTGVLSNEMANPEVAEFIYKMSEHENPAIRNKAALSLGSNWSKGVDGAVERLIEMMEDEDQEVRMTVYRYAGSLGDERVIEPVVKVLMDPEQVDLHSSCMNSLTSLWGSFPLYENTSEKAYRATIDYLKHTPRIKDMPSFSALSNIATIKSDSDKFQEWKQKASYYKPDELVQPMFDILKDPNTDWLACTSAIDVVKKHGSQEQFNSLKSIIESSEHPDKKLILDSYDTK